MAAVVKRKGKKAEIHPAKKHFTYNEAAGTNLCHHCNKEKKGNHASNLLRHLEAKHPEIHAEIYQDVVAHNNALRVTQKIDKSKLISVQINLDDLKKSMVAFCTVDGRPYSLMNDAGMQGILKPIYEACDQTKNAFRVNRHNIHAYCTADRTKMHDIIVEETKNKMITVQMDIVTVSDR